MREGLESDRDRLEGDGSMNPLVARIALLFTVVATLAACSARQVAETEIDQVERPAQLHVEHALHQVRLAMIATRAYYAHRGRQHDSGLVLDSAEVTINAAHVDTGQGEVALVITGGGQAQATASTSLKLTLDAPGDDEPDGLIRNEDREAIHVAMDRFRTESRLACAETVAAGDTANPDRPLWEAIARVAVAGLDGYLCAARHSEGMAMTGFELTVSVSTVASENEGFALKLGTWAVGSIATQEADDGMQVTLKFVSADGS